jgi:hypothetical protein
MLAMSTKVRLAQRKSNHPALVKKIVRFLKVLASWVASPPSVGLIFGMNLAATAKIPP